MNGQRSKNSSKKNVFGFTIIELLTIITIISILTSIMFLNWKSVGEDLKLQQAANKLTQDIRKVSEMALSAKVIDEKNPAKNFVPAGGYGIHLRIHPSKEIFIFADCNDDKRFTPGNQCGSPGSKFEEKLSSLELAREIEIVNSDELDIVFKPPNPMVYINEASSGEETITIRLKSNPNKQKNIKINSAGLVYVE